MSGWFRNEIGRAPAAWALVLVVLCAAAAYSNSLSSGFHYDDLHHIVGNPYLRDGKYASQYLHRPDMFSALQGHRMYRPMVLWTLHLNYQTGGYDPLHWRLTAIALHILATVGVFLTFLALAERLTEPPGQRRIGGALVAALFFALHPVFTETVNYASARSSLLATAAVVWAYWAHLKALDERRRPLRLGWSLLSLAVFAVGLLSKEIAIVFPALVLWTAIVTRRGYLAVLAPALLAVLYLVVRKHVLGTAVIDFSAREAARSAAEPGSGGARPILWNLFTQARVVCAYLLLFVWPFGLCIQREVRVSQSFLEAPVLFCTAILAALVVWAVRHRKRSFGLVWFLVALAPTSTVIPLNQVMNEHRLYLPGVGLAILVGSLYLRPRRARAWWAVPVAAAALLAVTLHRNRDWADPVRIWQSAVEVSPDSAGAWNSLGAQLRRRGDLDDAEHAFQKALTLDEHSWDASFNMGTLHLLRGRLTKADREFVEARRWLERSLRERPDSTRSRWYLAEVDHAMGRVDQAANEFRAMAGLTPRLYEMTRYPLARLALDRGEHGKARALYEEALRHGTDPVAACLGLGRVLLAEGDWYAAVAAAQRAKQLRPHSPEPYRFLAELQPGTQVAVQNLFEAERRGYRPTPAERRSILGE